MDYSSFDFVTGAQSFHSGEILSRYFVFLVHISLLSSLFLSVLR